MRRTIVLPRKPTLAELGAALDEVERELCASGAIVERAKPATLRFRVPPPWRRSALGALAGVSAGSVAVSAGAGRPWRVVYRLDFRRLRIFSAVAVAALVAVGWGWARETLIVAALACWAVTFALPWTVAARRARRVIGRAAHGVGVRRAEARPGSPSSAAAARNGLGGRDEPT